MTPAATTRALRCLLVILLCLVAAPPAQAADAKVKITSPSEYQVFQRNAVNRAAIIVAGTYKGTPKAIQARWRNGPWTTVDNTLTAKKGSFRGMLTNQLTGQGVLQVRFSNLPGVVDAKKFIGVGDIVVIAGQSNAVGRGTSPHQYTPTTLRASLFGNDDRWREFKDPYDSSVNQVDVVSRDGYDQMGSWLAVLVNGRLRGERVPIAILPAAKSSSTIQQWSRSTNRATLYGSMLRRVNAVGGRAKAVLWFQGENNSNTTAAEYRQRVNIFANNVSADFGAVTYPALIGPAPYVGFHRAGQRMGTLTAILENPRVEMGPALYDVNLDDERGDGMHFKSSSDLSIVGTRFLQAMRGHHGPELEKATLVCRDLRLKYSSIGQVTAQPSSLWVFENEIRIPVESMQAEGDVLRVTLARSSDGPIKISMGHDNRSGIGRAVYDSRGLPALPFHYFPVDVVDCPPWAESKESEPVE